MQTPKKVTTRDEPVLMHVSHILAPLLATWLIILSTAGCGVVQTAQEFNNTGNAFMAALQKADYQAAYELCMAELQVEIGEVADLQAMIEEQDARPQEWTFASWNLSTDTDQRQTAQVEGSVTYQDGRQGAVTLELIKVGEVWQVMSFNLTW